MTYLYHLTVTTGHARHSYRPEISNEALALCQGLLEEIAEVPEFRGGEYRIAPIHNA